MNKPVFVNSMKQPKRSESTDDFGNNDEDGDVDEFGTSESQGETSRAKPQPEEQANEYVEVVVEEVKVEYEE